jgi:hypothetical protein
MCHMSVLTPPSGAPPSACGTATTRRPAPRFDILRCALGDNFIAVGFEGEGHAVLTEHRQQEAVDRVLAFLSDKLS